MPQIEAAMQQLSKFMSTTRVNIFLFRRLFQFQFRNSISKAWILIVPFATCWRRKKRRTHVSGIWYWRRLIVDWRRSIDASLIQGKALISFWFPAQSFREKLFRGLPGTAAQRHVLFSLADRDAYAATTLSGVYKQVRGTLWIYTVFRLQLNLFAKAETDAERAKFGRELAFQISVVQYSVQCAINTLNSSI